MANEAHSICADAIAEHGGILQCVVAEGSNFMSWPMGDGQELLRQFAVEVAKIELRRKDQAQQALDRAKIKWLAQSALNGFETLDTETAVENAKHDLRALLICLELADD